MKKVKAETLVGVHAHTHTGNLTNKRKECRDYKSMFYLENSNKTWGYSLFCMEKGITLIALVITVIVLLILAGVTIATLTGENSIIEKAKWAAFSQEMTAVKEEVNIKQAENSAKLLEENKAQTIFSEHVIVKKLPTSLKMEILYVRENLPDDKEPTKDYYIEDMLDYLIDDSTYVKGLYYIPKEIVGDENERKYIYDELTNVVYRINPISLRWKTIHSYEYGCKVMGQNANLNIDTSKYIIGEESPVVTVSGESYYAPNLKGFNALTTYAEYYSSDYKEMLEVGISWHMNQQILNYIEDGNKTYTWYDYVNKNWANIKTTANKYEAWWTWVPRYAYKIESNTASEIQIIYIDTEGKPLNKEKYGNELPEGYIVHPAFTTDKELRGIWVSKYKPSYVKDKNNDVAMTNKVEPPDMNGFDKENTYLIKYSNDGSSIDSEKKLSELSDLNSFNSDNKWYNYENKLWANVKTVANGQEAWWVWVPRYAYRLPDNPNDDTEIIFIDINNKPLDTEKHGNSLPEDFIIHPAFDQDTNGSREKLKGIWVSKYKPSKE